MQLLLFNTIHSNTWKVCCCFIWNAISQKHLLFLPAALAFQTLFCFSVPRQAFDDHSQSSFSLPLPNLCSLSLFFFLCSHFTCAFLVVCGYVLLYAEKHWVKTHRTWILLPLFLLIGAMICSSHLHSPVICFLTYTMRGFGKIKTKSIVNM